MFIELYQQSSLKCALCPNVHIMDKLLKLYIFCFLCLFYVSKKLMCKFDSDSGQLCAIKEVRVVCDDQTSKECLKQLNQVILLFFKI